MLSFTLCASHPGRLLVFGLVGFAVSASAQTQAPPAQPLERAAPAQHAENAPPEEGDDLADGVGAPTRTSPATTQPVASAVDPHRAQELARLSVQLERQRAANRRWQVPTVGFGLGLLVSLVGGMLFLESVSEEGDTCYDEDHCGDEKGGHFLAGVTLLAGGSALLLISTPMLIVRGARQTRMQRTEAAIRQLGGQVSFAPRVGPRGDAGFRLQARF